ncbi:MAG: hypothetical protein ABIT20_20965 [Gemmatimonadaceae bacterium]
MTGAEIQVPNAELKTGSVSDLTDRCVWDAAIEVARRLPPTGATMESCIVWRLEAAVAWCEYEATFCPGGTVGDEAAEALKNAQRAYAKAMARVTCGNIVDASIFAHHLLSSDDQRRQALSIYAAAMINQESEPALAHVYAVIHQWVQQLLDIEATP